MSTDKPTPELTPADRALAEAAGERLRQSATELDAATASRLTRARHVALALGRGQRTPWPVWLAPALSTATVAAIGLGLWLSLSPVPTTAPDPADLEILLSDADLSDAATPESTTVEMMEDLEFYAWLDAERPVADLADELQAAQSLPGTG